MSIPFVIKIVIRLILLTCIGSLVLNKAAKKAAVPTAMRQGSKVKALVEAGVGLLQVMEQLGISKASYYRCLVGELADWMPKFASYEPEPTLS